MALEDAAVLAELLVGRDALDQDLWDAFHARRFERVRPSSTPPTSWRRWLLDHVQRRRTRPDAPHRRAHQPARLRPTRRTDMTQNA